MFSINACNIRAFACFWMICVPFFAKLSGLIPPAILLEKEPTVLQYCPHCFLQFVILSNILII